MAESRAILLLRREYHRLQKYPLWGIAAEPVRGSLLEWAVTIQGPPDSAWAGGMFQLEMYFDENFDSTPPQVHFLTVPFHPNVDMDTGEPCAALLNADVWQRAVAAGRPFTLSGVLLQLQQLLSEPELLDAANPTAASIYATAPRLYQQLAQDCVVASQRIAQGLDPFMDELPKQAEAAAEAARQDSVKSAAVELPTTRRVSFEQYYQTWVQRGTSKTHAANGADLIKNYANFVGASSGGTEPSASELCELVEQQRQLWYGRFAFARRTGDADAPYGQLQAQRRLRRVAQHAHRPGDSGRGGVTQHQRADRIAALRRMYALDQEAEEYREDIPDGLRSPHASLDLLASTDEGSSKPLPVATSEIRVPDFQVPAANYSLPPRHNIVGSRGHVRGHSAYAFDYQPHSRNESVGAVADHIAQQLRAHRKADIDDQSVGADYSIHGPLPPASSATPMPGALVTSTSDSDLVQWSQGLDEALLAL